MSEKEVEKLQKELALYKGLFKEERSQNRLLIKKLSNKEILLEQQKAKNKILRKELACEIKKKDMQQ